MKRRALLGMGLAAAALPLAACEDEKDRAVAVYALLDVSGSYIRELDKAIRAPDMMAWMASIGAQPVGGGAAAAQAMVDRERARWARDIPPLNIRVD